MKKNMKLLISIINLPDQVIEIKKSNLILGRANTCDIILSDSLCSSKHCQIAIFDDYVELTDLQSKNGTFVNDEKISKINLKFNQPFKIGNASFIIYDKSMPDLTSSIAILELESSLGENSDNFKRLPGNIAGKFNPSEKRSSNKSSKSFWNTYLTNNNTKYLFVFLVLVVMIVIKKMGII